MALTRTDAATAPMNWRVGAPTPLPSTTTGTRSKKPTRCCCSCNSSKGGETEACPLAREDSMEAKLLGCEAMSRPQMN